MIDTVFLVNKTVHKSEDRFVGKVKCGLVAHDVSPYLHRPLRSLAGVLAGRKAAESAAAGTSRDSLPAEVRPSPSGSGRAPNLTD